MNLFTETVKKDSAWVLALIVLGLWFLPGCASNRYIPEVGGQSGVIYEAP